MIVKSKNIIAIFVIIIIAVTSFNLVYIASPKSIYAQSLEEQLEQIQKEREEAQEKIKDARKQEQEYINQVDEVENQLTSALSELAGLNQKLADATKEV